MHFFFLQKFVDYRYDWYFLLSLYIFFSCKNLNKLCMKYHFLSIINKNGRFLDSRFLLTIDTIDIFYLVYTFFSCRNLNKLSIKYHFLSIINKNGRFLDSRFLLTIDTIDIFYLVYTLFFSYKNLNKLSIKYYFLTILNKNGRIRTKNTSVTAQLIT